MFQTVDLMPHAVCWAAAPKLIWTMVITNFVTFLSYVSICITLLYLVSRTRRVIARDWAYFVVGFALFIVACGSTHLLEVITTWIPLFWIDAGTNVVTALLSAYVAVMLIKRASAIGFAISDYSDRLANAEEEKRAIEEKLLSARKLEDWSRLSAVIAHEIGNPLETIQNMMYVIATDPDASSATVEMAEQAQQEVERVITISRSTLSFHRESKEPEMIDLRSVCESVCFLLQSVIVKKGIEFKILGEGPFWVKAFPGETRQVILNLARNACEAISERGRSVSLSLSSAPGGVELEIVDEGTGMSKAIVSSLFEFGKTSKGEQGNGLGLWSVKQIITKHGGSINLASSSPSGTRFLIWWPEDHPSMAQAGVAAIRHSS
ncbi:signal transduction histidine kinase [Granulicella aggregans]|uniref:histidine kinase n=1 Tax=Granulicella aggregans TaxID=474949 RepID=A0A7W8E6I4_9BACT|nr:HAMP domain-containing sensor histidine kinase [Granulicella aggregans]MBB5060721.1 signal transduction histidine kinase [Granulicella aggregans]